MNVSASPNQFTDAGEIFASVSNDFRNTLSEDEKEFIQCKDCQELIQSIKKICDDHPIHSQRLTRCCRLIQHFTGKLAPFFEIIGIFVQSDPFYASLVWGALRVIFLMGSQYVTFLEKISKMFDTMASRLPAYEEFVHTIRERAEKDDRPSYSRLLTALSYVYTDILQYCQQAYQLFARKKSKVTRASFILNFFWRPFDLRFAELLQRFDEHRQLFEFEMHATHIIDIAKLLENYDTYETKITEPARLAQNSIQKDKMLLEAQLREKEVLELHSRMRELRDWINAPNWADMLEDISMRRTAGTGDWLFCTQDFEAWRGAVLLNNEQMSDSSESVLLVQGNPGYGKTFLCASLLDQLRHMCSSEITEHQLPTNTPTNVAAFYFFNKLSSRSNLPVDGFRAILMQLLHSQRADCDIVDAASILMNDQGTGQLVASPEEVSSLIQLVLGRLKTAVLVFDGVDECSQPGEFFRFLSENINASKQRGKCAVAIFSRPDVIVPRSLRIQARLIKLNPTQNLEDIRSYLDPKIGELLDYGLLPEDMDRRAIVEKTSSYANGMFLWARLLVEYLQSDALTTQDRLDALDNLVFLEGLDRLYSAIFDNIRKKNPERARQHIRRMFQLALGAMRPLRAIEFKTALTLSSSKHQSRNDSIPNLEENLSRMSGALLEIYSDETVRFVHTSVAEYLTGFHLELRTSPNLVPEGFDFPRGETHCVIAETCLSYLCHDVPPGPLSGHSQITPDRQLQQRAYPLLHYALQYWVIHASEGLCSFSSGSSGRQDDTARSLVMRLTELIQDKNHVSKWIEASFLLGIAPTLGSLPLDFKRLYVSLEGGEQAHRVERVAALLEEFEQDLDTLIQMWTHVLTKTPNEIWEPSIPTFTKSRFWVGTKETKLASLATKGRRSDQSITIQSQVSSNGREIGLIKLLPPESLADTSILTGVQHTFTHQFTAAGWVAIYEIWSLSSLKIILKLPISLPENDILPLIQTQVHDSLENCRFEFPVAFAGDLRTVLVLGSLISIRSAPLPDLTCEFVCSFLDPWSTTCFERDARTPDTYPFLAILSPSGKYMLLLRPSMWRETRFSEIWDFEVFGHYPEYLKIKPMASFSVPCDSLPFTLNKLQTLNQHAKFHPHLPFVAIALKTHTLLWKCNATDSPPVEIYGSHVKNMSFSNCGDYLHGMPSYFSKEYAVIDLKPMLYGAESLKVSQELAMPASQTLARLAGNYGSMRSLAAGAAPATQGVNAVVFGQSESGKAQMSVLRRFWREGALVLHTFSEEGTAQSETVSRLPRGVNLGEAILIAPVAGENPENHRLVLNKAPQRFYQFNHNASAGLPLVLDRTRRSIPSFVTNTQSLLGASEPDLKRIQHRHTRSSALSVNDSTRNHVAQSYLTFENVQHSDPAPSGQWTVNSFSASSDFNYNEGSKSSTANRIASREDDFIRDSSEQFMPTRTIWQKRLSLRRAVPQDPEKRKSLLTRWIRR